MQTIAKISFLFAFLVNSFFPCFSQSEGELNPFGDFDDNADEPVLLVFSGSDWCSNCIRFNKEVLSDSTFGDH